MDSVNNYTIVSTKEFVTHTTWAIEIDFAPCD